MKKIFFILFFVLFAKESLAFNIVTVGDIADCGSENAIRNTKNVSDLVKAKIIDKETIFVPIGDLVYPSGTKERFDNCYLNYYGDLIKKTFPVLGNHEYYANNGEDYIALFSKNINVLKEQKKYNGEKINTFPKYYAFSKEFWRLIFLDTNLKENDLNEQLNWLETELSNKNEKCVVMFYHHPAITSGIRGGDEVGKKFFSLAQKHKVSLVFNGHYHHFEENKKINGVQSFIVGTGGVKIKEVYNPLSLLDSNYRAGEYGVINLTLEKDFYNVDFVTKNGILISNKGVCND